jgi:hypothetical protein
MCILIVKTPEGKLSDDELKACHENNRDGGGFSFVDDSNKVVVQKGFFDFDKFLEAYRPIEAQFGPKGPMLVHFRISTGGTRTSDNCHPFLFKHGAFAHNGVFFSPPADDGRSDTNMLVAKIGNNLSKKMVQLHKKAIEDAFGSYNKAAILYPDRTYEIFNEKQGDWKDGVWFSNTHWKWRMGGNTSYYGATTRYRADGLRVADSVMGDSRHPYGVGYSGPVGWEGMDD